MKEYDVSFVPTTIGNLEDVTIRAVKSIFLSPVVFAEDTRVFKKLKTLLIEKHPKLVESILADSSILENQKVYSYREQNHDYALNTILKCVENGEKVIITTDAGMPGISDPGFKLVSDLYTNGISIDVLPGASSVDTALVLSGMPTDKFTFLGFLPRKPGKIKKILDKFLLEDITVVVFESPFRIKSLLKFLLENYSESLQVVLVSELTKRNQNIYKGEIKFLYNYFTEHNAKGEWVVCIRKISGNFAD